MATRNRSRVDRLSVFVALTAAIAVGCLWLSWVLDTSIWTDDVDWTAVAVLSAFLVIGEMHSIGWLRARDGGEVTPGWAFIFAVLLLGSPVAAVGAAVVSTLIPDILRRKGLLRTAFNASQNTIAITLATAALTLAGRPYALGGDRAVGLPWLTAILVSALMIFVANSVLTAVVIALHQQIAIRSTLRQATGLSISADGALLVLSPLFVIAIRSSLFVSPLLALIAFLVFHSARQALEREHRSSQDHLTALLNARAFHEHLAGHLRARRRGIVDGCVVLLDLDGFKLLNDQLGHHVGDVVLQQVGGRLSFDRKFGAVGARLGGDEFAVFFPDAATADDGLAIAQLVAESVGRPLIIEGTPISVRASVGVALIDDQLLSTQDVLRAADRAMYQAKRNRSTIAIAEPFESADAQGGRSLLLGDLQSAFERSDELTMVYQPIVDVHAGIITSFEALVRWNHPILGSVSPAEFVPLCENTDLIDVLTERVLGLVCDDVALFRQHDPALRIAVNISTANLRRRDFPERIADQLATFGVDPSSLQFEITESAFDVQPDVTIDVITRLRALGLSIAIDDFGAGYSWFSRLMDLPVDNVKIDRSLVARMCTDPRGLPVVKAIIELAHALGHTCTAEGVEALALVGELRTLGCDYLQGFAITRPLPIADALLWLDLNSVIRPNLQEPVS